jgi:hypothetical protein
MRERELLLQRWNRRALLVRRQLRLQGDLPLRWRRLRLRLRDGEVSGQRISAS